MQTDEYKTLEEVAQGLYKDKGSKFIALALPVESVEDVKINLEQLRKQYHDARHHCYAYRIGEEPYDFRYNDDGEPSGTAGKPIFGQIQSYELTNVLIVVIRYFGGVKLGTGRLIQAYRNAAKDAIDKGKVMIKHWVVMVEIRFDYLQMNDVMRTIKEEGLKIIRQDVKNKYCILLEIRKGNFEVVKKKLLSFEKIEWTVI